MSTPDTPPQSYVVPPFGTTPDGPAPDAAAPLMPLAGVPGEPANAAAPAARERSGLGTYAALAAAGLVIGAAGTWALGAVNDDAVAGTVDRAASQQGGVPGGMPGSAGQGQAPGTADGQSGSGQSNGMVPPGTSTDGSTGSGTTDVGSTGDGTQGWTPQDGSGSTQQGPGGMAPPPGGMGHGGGQGPMGTSGGS